MKKALLIKFTGEIFEAKFAHDLLPSLVQQCKELSSHYNIGIVVGGGNIMRGALHGPSLGLSPLSSHTIGMIATIMNGVILHDKLSAINCFTELLSAIECPQVVRLFSQQRVTEAKNDGRILIFVGGTGLPYVTTDTAGVIRALQIDAFEYWKVTKTDGIYNKDPNVYSDAIKIPQLTYDEALQQNLHILDSTAYILAQKNRLTTRVFSVFEKNCLLNAARDDAYGSIIVP